MIDGFKHFLFEGFLGQLLRCAIIAFFSLGGFSLLHLALNDFLNLFGRIRLGAAKNQVTGTKSNSDQQQATTTKNQQFFDQAAAFFGSASFSAIYLFLPCHFASQSRSRIFMMLVVSICAVGLLCPRAMHCLCQNAQNGGFALSKVIVSERLIIIVIFQTCCHFIRKSDYCQCYSGQYCLQPLRHHGPVILTGVQSGITAIGACRMKTKPHACAF